MPNLSLVDSVVSFCPSYLEEKYSRMQATLNSNTLHKKKNFHFTVSFNLPLPNFRGYTGPGGLGEEYPQAYNCTGGMAGYIDRIALGKHIYRWPTTKVYISFRIASF